MNKFKIGIITLLVAATSFLAFTSGDEVDCIIIEAQITKMDIINSSGMETVDYKIHDRQIELVKILKKYRSEGYSIVSHEYKPTGTYYHYIILEK